MARTLTDEEKKARAEARKAAKEAKEAEAREEVKKEENNEIELLKARNEMLMKQMEALMAQMQDMQKPQTGISGNFVGRIKGAKCPFDLQFLTWDVS